MNAGDRGMQDSEKAGEKASDPREDAAGNKEASDQDQNFSMNLNVSINMGKKILPQNIFLNPTSSSAVNADASVKIAPEIQFLAPINNSEIQLEPEREFTSFNEEIEKNEQSIPRETSQTYPKLLKGFPYTPYQPKAKQSSSQCCCNGTCKADIKGTAKKDLGERKYRTKEEEECRQNQELTMVQKQYTTHFNVRQFLEEIADPVGYFENKERKGYFDPAALNFLKNRYHGISILTIRVKYELNKYNLALTAKELDCFNRDYRDIQRPRQRRSFRLPTNVSLLQEMAFVTHRNLILQMLEKNKKEKIMLRILKEFFEAQRLPGKSAGCANGHVFSNSCIEKGTDSALANTHSLVPPLKDITCNNPSGSDRNCREISAPSNEDRKVEEFWSYVKQKVIQAFLRTCLRCKWQVIKKDDCNKMVCVCGTEMCHVCNEIVTDSSHFHGPQWATSYTQNSCPFFTNSKRQIDFIVTRETDIFREKYPHLKVDTQNLSLSIYNEFREFQKALP